MTSWGKAAIMLGVGTLIGTVLRIFLPRDRGGPSFLYAGVWHVVPYNRFAFWFCLGVSVIAAMILVGKSVHGH
jgi:hypothetical protein